MMMEEREVIGVKEYYNRATGLQNYKQIRKAPKNYWKKQIVDKALEFRREGKAITDVPRIFVFEGEENAPLAEILDDEESDTSDDEQ